MEENDSSPKSMEDLHLQNLPDQLIRGVYSICCNCSNKCTEQNVS